MHIKSRAQAHFACRPVPVQRFRSAFRPGHRKPSRVQPVFSGHPSVRDGAASSERLTIGFICTAGTPPGAYSIHRHTVAEPAMHTCTLHCPRPSSGSSVAAGSLSGREGDCLRERLSGGCSHNVQAFSLLRLCCIPKQQKRRQLVTAVFFVAVLPQQSYL